VALLSGHTGMTFEIFGSVGVALPIIAVCLVVADRLPRTVFPLAAVGSMALTAYAGGIVAVAVTATLDYATNYAWLVFVVVTTAAATLWRLFLGRSPLERLLAWSSIRATEATSAFGTTRTAGAPMPPEPSCASFQSRNAKTETPAPHRAE